MTGIFGEQGLNPSVTNAAIVLARDYRTVAFRTLGAPTLGGSTGFVKCPAAAEKTVNVVKDNSID
jgi:hypothetical protein